MLDITFILENREIVKKAVADKQKDPVDFDRLEELYVRRTEMAKVVQSLQHERKVAAEMRDRERGSVLKERLAEAESSLRLLLRMSWS